MPASLADRITLSRILVVPLLCAAAALRIESLFLAFMTYGLLTDFVDGTIARLRGAPTAHGAQLDSRADAAFYPALAVSLWLMYAERLQRLAPLYALLVVAYVVPIGCGWLKFRRLTAYHTNLARASLVALTVALLAWIVTDDARALWGAGLLFVLSSLEEVAITWVLDAPRHNVQHFRRALRLRRRTPPHSSARSAPVPSSTHDA